MHDEDDKSDGSADSDEPNVAESSLDEPLLDENERDGLGGGQLSLLGMLGLLTVLSIYFALRRYHQGQFGIHLLAAVGLTVVVVLPGLWLVALLVRLVADGDVLVPLAILAVVITGGVLASLFSFWR